MKTIIKQNHDDHFNQVSLKKWNKKLKKLLLKEKSDL